MTLMMPGASRRLILWSFTEACEAGCANGALLMRCTHSLHKQHGAIFDKGESCAVQAPEDS